MPKKVRDYLFIVFIVLFVFMTIGISLYASGYKFNLSWPLRFNRLLQKTGMLALATVPSRAIVYLNDVPQKNLSVNPWKKDYLTTPVKIKNILPGEYELRLEETGYWPYKQKIWINSGQTTFVEDVNLFKENLPLLVLSTPEDSLALSPDKKYLFLDKTKKIINLKNETTRALTYNENANGVWLKNNKLLAAGIIFDPIKNTNDLNFVNLIGVEVTNWHYDDNSGYLYYQNKNSINRVDINNKTNSLVISGDNYLDYKIIQDKIFALTTKNNQVFLDSYYLKNSDFENQWTMPSSGHYSFVDIPNYLAVYDDKNRTLYLFNETITGSSPAIIRNIKNWTVYNDQSLIYTNDFEIYIYNFASSRSDLITRRSEEIDSVIYNATGNYLIFSTPNSLNAFDFKNWSATLLFKSEKVSTPTMDEKNKNLYFWARVGQQEGVYQIMMQ